MKIALCNDHAGYELKKEIEKYLQERGIEYVDFGCNTTASADYADYAHPAALAVEAGDCNCGIAICGSGNGIQMTLNKHQSIRAALCWMPEIASLAKQHNDANFCVMPGRFITPEMANLILDAYLVAQFEGGRHAARIAKMPIGLPGF